MTAHRKTFEPQPELWKEQAACADTDPELFFPVGTTGPAIEQIETAKQICRLCTVREECLEYALAMNEQHGIWGGLTEDERRQRHKSSSSRRTS